MRVNQLSHASHALGEPRIGCHLARTGNAAQNTRRRGPVKPICIRRPIFQAWTTRSNASFRAASPPERGFSPRPAEVLYLRGCASPGSTGPPSAHCFKSWLRALASENTACLPNYQSENPATHTPRSASSAPSRVSRLSHTQFVSAVFCEPTVRLP